MKLLLHAYYAPFLLFHKCIWSCNVLEGSLHFFDHCVGYINSFFNANTNCLIINTWLIIINSPHTMAWILPSFVNSKVHKNSSNMSLHGMVQAIANRLAKLAFFAHSRVVKINVTQPFCVKRHIDIYPNILVMSVGIDAWNFLITPRLPPKCMATKNEFGCTRTSNQKKFVTNFQSPQSIAIYWVSITIQKILIFGWQPKISIVSYWI